MRASRTAKAAHFTFHDVSIIDINCLYFFKAKLVNFSNLLLSMTFWISAIILHCNGITISKFHMEPEPNDSVL
jgi:hypothetical protein